MSDDFWDGSGRPPFNGSDYDPARDDGRLSKQIGRVYDVAIEGHWRALHEIEQEIRRRTGVHDPEASISAQLRHLRKDRFGAYRLEKRRRTEGLWEYRLLPPEPKSDHQRDLFDA